MAAVVPRLSKTPGRVVHSGHRIGQDTREVLRSFLRYTETRIDALEAAGVVTCDRSHAPRGSNGQATAQASTR